MKPNRLLFIIGTTAEAIKIAPILERLGDVSFEIWVTNQHPGKVPNYLKELGVSSSVYEIGAREKPFASLAAGGFWFIRTFLSLVFQLSKRKKMFSAVIVHGDTATCALGAIAGFVAGVEVCHIESGLRTGNFLRPFPEEIFRFVSDACAAVNFAPSEHSKNNLERVFPKKVAIDTKGNTVKDALRNIIPVMPEFITFESFGLAFFHRGELLRQKKRLIETYRAAAELSTLLPMVIIYDPVTEGYLRRYRIWNEISKLDNVHLVPKMPYEQFEWLLRSCNFLISDSPGQQQEARELRVPCLVHRRYIEEKPNILSGGETSLWDPSSFYAFASKHLGPISKGREITLISPSAIVAAELSDRFSG